MADVQGVQKYCLKLQVCLCKLLYRLKGNRAENERERERERECVGNRRGGKRDGRKEGGREKGSGGSK